MLGSHKIGAAISGPRIAGGKIADTRIFRSLKHTMEEIKSDGVSR